MRRLKAEVMHAQESGPAPGRSIPKFGLSNGENYDKPRGAVGVPYFQTNPTDYQEKISGYYRVRLIKPLVSCRFTLKKPVKVVE